jgi:hypothetical protein
MTGGVRNRADAEWVRGIPEQPVLGDALSQNCAVALPTS